MVRQSYNHFRWIELLNPLTFLFFFSIFMDLTLLFDPHSFYLLKNSFYLVGERTVFIFYLLNKALYGENRKSIIFAQTALDHIYIYASLLLPAAGVPCINILFGFNPLEVLNSPTTEPISLAKPSLYFQAEIVGKDLLSMTISEVKTSKYS